MVLIEPSYKCCVIILSQDVWIFSADVKNAKIEMTSGDKFDLSFTYILSSHNLKTFCIKNILNSELENIKQWLALFCIFPVRKVQKEEKNDT